MDDTEQIRLYADILVWFLYLLAAFGVPVGIAAPFMMIMKMRLMEDTNYRPPPVHPDIRPEFVKTDGWGRWKWLCRRTGTPKSADEVIYDGVRWLRPAGKT